MEERKLHCGNGCTCCYRTLRQVDEYFESEKSFDAVSLSTDPKDEKLFHLRAKIKALIAHFVQVLPEDALGISIKGNGHKECPESTPINPSESKVENFIKT